MAATQSGGTQGRSGRVVWILNHYAQVPSGPGGTRHYWLARHLIAHQWHALVVASSTEHNTGRLRIPLDSHRATEEIDGVPFLWLRAPAYRGNGIGRLRNMLTFAARASKIGSYDGLARPDVVIGSSVHPFSGCAGLRLAKRFDVPFIFEIRDLWPETLIAFGRVKRNGIVAGVMRVIEKQLCRRASRIVTVLPRAEEYLRERVGVGRDAVSYIPNGIELSCRPPGNTYFRDDADKFSFMYLGAHGQANDLWTVLGALELLEQKVGPERFVFRFIGEGPQKHQLIEAARSMGLASVQFEPSIPSAKVHAVAAQADCFVLTARDCPELYRYGVSMNKIFDYMAAGRPTVVALSAANNPVAEARAGLTVEPQNPEALAQGLLDVLNMSPVRRQKMGLRGREFVEDHHDYVTLAKSLAAVLDGVVS